MGAPGDLVQGTEFTGRHARQTMPKGKPRGGIVEAVVPGSPAARSEIAPGDTITAVNGHRLRDVIDYQFHGSCALVRLEVVGPSGRRRTLELLKDEGQSVGITFTQPTFAPIRECNNHCPFCFIDQLPAEMRSSLYIRDDDYRYSFLFGNFVTLTNLNERDWERLAEQRLSPLYISVHSTDVRLRRTLLGNERAPEILPQLRRLAAMGIEMHAQVVVCPGLNDGDALAETVDRLASLAPDVLSIGIVPVGLTRTPAEILAGPGASCSRILPSAAYLDLRTMTPAEAARIVKQVKTWQRQCKERFGHSLVHASDEIYLIAGAGFPSASSYDGYPQYENGIGMVRDLIDDWNQTRTRMMRRSPFRGRVRSASVVCGEMIAPVMGAILEEWSSIAGVRAELVPLVNTFFGPRVTVSGLLTARDVVAARARLRGDLVILPEVMLDKTGARLLDNVTPAELESRMGKPVRFAGMMSQFSSVVDAFEDVTSDERPRSRTAKDGKVMGVPRSSPGVAGEAAL